jgi:hypothetical protein
VTNARVDGIADGDTGSTFLQMDAADETGDERIDGKGAQREGAEENDAGMGAGRILAKVGEFDIKHQQHAQFTFGSSCDFGMRLGKEVFVGDRQDIAPNPSNTGFK